MLEGYHFLAFNNQMERYTIALIVLFATLIVGSLFMQEGYVDASGTDVSGGIISLSISDLLRLLGGLGPSSTTTPSTTTTIIQPTTPETSLDDQFLTSLRGDIRRTVRKELQKQAAGSQTVLTDSCIDSVADQQGTDWMRYIPGKNPADYIRKDSIPCYSCSLP